VPAVTAVAGRREGLVSAAPARPGQSAGAPGHVDEEDSAALDVRLNAGDVAGAEELLGGARQVHDRHFGRLQGRHVGQLHGRRVELGAGLPLEPVDVRAQAPGSGSQLPAYSARPTFTVASGAVASGATYGVSRRLRKLLLPAA